MDVEHARRDRDDAGAKGWDRGMRAGAAIAVTCLLALGAPAGAAGQTLEAGVGIARTQNPVSALSDAMCPAERTWAGEGRAGVRFSRIVALEGTVAYHWESAGEDCAEPVPGSGPFERTTMRAVEAGYPFLSTDARLAFEPSNPSGRIWFRAFGGYGRMWSKDVGYWLAGAGVVFGGQLEALLDFEWNWFDLPTETIVESYLDGALIDEQTEVSDMSHSTFRIKAGLRFRP